MSATVEVTREDECLLRALATLVEHLPPEKHAVHLRPKCIALATRIQRALPKEA